MTFLPIVERELRIAARRKGTHWLRFVAALLVILAVGILLVGSASSRSQAQVGQMVFTAVSVMAFAFCLVAGVFLTADCLCSERREGTLGLLFLTDLKGYDVVLGKLVANSVVSVYAVLAIIPMLGLPLLMGGVTFAEFTRTTLALLLTLLLSLSSGMLASVVCRETRAAVTLSFCVMLALTAGLYLLAFAVSTGVAMRVPWILVPSPLVAFINSRAAWYDLQTGFVQYWASMGFLVTMALVLLIVTSVKLPSAWQDKEMVSKRPPEPGTVQPRRRVPLLANPFEWLVSREPLFGWRESAVLIGLFAAWLWLMASIPFEEPRKTAPLFVTAFCIAFGLHVIAKGLLAMEAGRRLSEDRRSGALELLLATPVSPRAILAGQWQALKRQFMGLNAGLVLMNLSMVALVAIDHNHLHMSGDVAGMFCLFFLGGIFLLWVDFHAIGWVAMWMGLRGLRHHRAAFNALGHVLLPPWIAVFLFFMLAVNSGVSRGTMMLCWTIWIGLSVASAQVAVARRKHRLLHDFRRLAAGDWRNGYVEAGTQRNPDWNPAAGKPASRAR